MLGATRPNYNPECVLPIVGPLLSFFPAWTSAIAIVLNDPKGIFSNGSLLLGNAIYHPKPRYLWDLGDGSQSSF